MKLALKLHPYPFPLASSVPMSLASVETLTPTQLNYVTTQYILHLKDLPEWCEEEPESYTGVLHTHTLGSILCML
jgi:hypothetical protein